MLFSFLQVWGGLFFLLNKIFFSMAERASNHNRKQKLQICAWLVFLIALPAWIFVFISERNWIAAAVEAGGAPAMVVGLYIALRGNGNEPAWLDYFAKIAVGVGLGFSFYDFGGVVSFVQILELGIAIGFLLGTYQTAKQQPSGYFWFVVGNISCAILMGKEGYTFVIHHPI